jgi:3'(2'), 5'-bisphosphate nucleotidase
MRRSKCAVERPYDLTNQELLEALIDPVRDACRVIESIRATGIKTETKSDQSPVTQADQAAEDIIFAALQKLTPNMPRVGEEAFSLGFVPEDCGSTFWLIDPIDGTRDFISGGTSYTVNIALVSNYYPVLGIVATPADGRIWLGAVDVPAQLIEPDGSRERISVRPQPEKPVVLMSRSHLDEATKNYVATLGDIEPFNIGSSLKFCVIAEGKADIYPRFGPTSEWDTAAGHAVLLGAGGTVTNPDGTAFTYGKQGFLNGPFIARGRK